MKMHYYTSLLAVLEQVRPFPLSLSSDRDRVKA